MHCMLDLETLDTKPTSLILSIGAVAFDKDDIYEEFYKIIKVSDADMKNFSVSASTLNWWFTQSEALKEFAKQGRSLEDSLYEFEKFMQTTKCKEVWGNGSMFDNMILGNAYRVMNIQQPWHYRDDCCYRTIIGRFPKLCKKFVGTRHSAIDDARFQANYLIELNKTYNLNIL